MAGRLAVVLGGNGVAGKAVAGAARAVGRSVSVGACARAGLVGGVDRVGSSCDGARAMSGGGAKEWMAQKLVERTDFGEVVASTQDEVDVAFLTDAAQELMDMPTIRIPDDDSAFGYGGGPALDGAVRTSLDMAKFPDVSGVDPFSLVTADLRSISDDIKTILGVDHPVLSTVAKYFFEADGGKKIRPAMVILVSRAANEHSVPSETVLSKQDAAFEKGGLLPTQRRLGEITELIHTASLLHDDVIDMADTRRGRGSVNRVFGNKLAVLAGDFLLSRASVSLARLRDVEVIELMSTVIEHLVKGEVMQMRTAFRNENALETAFDMYMRKTYYKTASLMSNSCKSAAVLAGHPPAVQESAFLYGKHVGLAFQLVDDLLDFEGSLESLGKPALNDLRLGLATAPVLFATRSHPNMIKLIERKFEAPGDVEEACGYVVESDGIAKTRSLALTHAQLALDAIEGWEDSEARTALAALVTRVVERTF